MRPTYPPPHPALVVEPDADFAQALERILGDHGCEVASHVGSAVDAISVVRHVHPRIVVVTNELTGTTGVDALDGLRAESDVPGLPETILVTHDLALREHGLAAGAFAVVDRTDSDALDEAVGDVVHLLETGERRSKVDDRRAGEDRRQHQDWTKVTSERRSGEDRREGDRREGG